MARSNQRNEPLWASKRLKDLPQVVTIGYKMSWSHRPTNVMCCSWLCCWTGRV